METKIVEFRPGCSGKTTASILTEGYGASPLLDVPVSFRKVGKKIQLPKLIMVAKIEHKNILNF